MHWATLRRHSDLSWAFTSTSSQVVPILNTSLLTVLLQIVCRLPGPLLNPGTSQCNAGRCMCWWSIRVTRPSQRSHLSLSTMSSILCCPVLILTCSFVIISVTGKSTIFQSGWYIHRVYPNRSQLNFFGEEGAWAYIILAYTFTGSMIYPNKSQ